MGRDYDEPQSFKQVDERLLVGQSLLVNSMQVDQNIAGFGPPRGLEYVARMCTDRRHSPHEGFLVVGD